MTSSSPSIRAMVAKKATATLQRRASSLHLFSAWLASSEGPGDLFFASPGANVGEWVGVEPGEQVDEEIGEKLDENRCETLCEDVGAKVVELCSEMVIFANNAFE